jgi:hypothetical protein
MNSTAGSNAAQVALPQSLILLLIATSLSSISPPSTPPGEECNFAVPQTVQFCSPRDSMK